MSDLTPQLVALYAEHGTNGVRNDPAFLALCEAHEEDTGFDATRNDVQRVMAELELSVDDHKHPEQVRFALETLNAFKRESNRMILRELVHARYFPHWSDNLKAYFDWAAERLGWPDYFLSFTSYNPTDDVNVVNSTHKYLIRDRIPNTWKERQAESRANLLAEMIDNLLRNAQLDGFYWKRHEGDSSKVEEKLTENAQRSLAFVQLLQSAMFAKVPPPNFCHLEYKLAVEDESRTLIFLRAEPLAGFVTRATVDIELRTWFDDIAERDPYELAPTPSWVRATIDANLAGIQEKVVDQVKAARKSLFTGVPQQ